MCALASTASAQNREGFALDRFSPAPTTEDGLALVLPRTMGHLRPAAQLTLDYAHRPLVLSKGGQDAEGAIVGHRLMAHAVAALGLGSRGEVFVHLPIALVQNGDKPELGAIRFADPSGASVAGVRAGGSVRFLGGDMDAFQLGAFAALVIPTGTENKLSTDKGLTGEARLTAAYNLPRWTFAANAGFRYRHRADYGSARIGNEVPFVAGAYYRATEHLTGLAELNGALGFRGQAFKSVGTPMELLAGARLATDIQLAFTGAVGLGLTQAPGTPDVRVILQAGYPSPRPPFAKADRDKDGIPDERDTCPEAPEDFDNYEDADGCPELDNDNDGVLDTGDACPLDPEDLDQFEDQDGCPEPDNDKDGVPDQTDQCPVAPEDTDGYADEDGCPDLDNDKDGIPDANDSCVDEPEDVDGFQDDDGCPEPDNDKDGVLDIDDRCPTVPGPKETRGCPSAVRIDRSQIRILERIEFETNRAEIRPESLNIISQVRQALEVNPQIRRVRIEGHTDSRGSNQKNITLSQRRAESVMKFLVDEGIDPGRLEAKGWGEEHPIVPDDSESNMQTNRRVEFHIVDPAPPAEGSSTDGGAL
jgi:outer membrane protein OmpA-like peptidoglycan-associated protein